LTCPVDACNLESIGSSSVVGPVHVISHHQDDIEEGFELYGMFQIMTSVLKQYDTLLSKQ
jgi:hypothetical protein